MNDQELGIKAGQIARCKTGQNLRRVGITRSYYMRKLKELCEATRPISCIRGKDADGGTVDFIEVPDNQTQLGAIRTIIDLYGDKAALKVDNKHEGSLEVLITNFAGASDPLAEKQKATGGRRK